MGTQREVRVALLAVSSIVASLSQILASDEKPVLIVFGKYGLGGSQTALPKGGVHPVVGGYVLEDQYVFGDDHITVHRGRVIAVSRIYERATRQELESLKASVEREHGTPDAELELSEERAVRMKKPQVRYLWKRAGVTILLTWRDKHQKTGMRLAYHHDALYKAWRDDNLKAGNRARD